MKSRAQLIGMIVFFAAALIYTVYNYINGTTELFVLLTAVVITGIPLLNLFRLLIESFRKK